MLSDGGSHSSSRRRCPSDSYKNTIFGFYGHNNIPWLFPFEFLLFKRGYLLLPDSFTIPPELMLSNAPTLLH